VKILDAYRTAKALADLGHADSPVIPHADMNMAATLADVPRPATSADRAAVCDALDEISSTPPSA
jgi:hypothetical protein